MSEALNGWTVRPSKYGVTITAPSGAGAEIRNPATECVFGDNPVLWDFLQAYMQSTRAALSDTGEDAHTDDTAVDAFASAMKEKLAKSREKGRGGWDSPECEDEYLAELLAEHVRKGNDGNFVDVANFAMMLHMRKAPPNVMPSAFSLDPTAAVVGSMVESYACIATAPEHIYLCVSDDLADSRLPFPDEAIADITWSRDAAVNCTVIYERADLRHNAITSLRAETGNLQSRIADLERQLSKARAEVKQAGARVLMNMADKIASTNRPTIAGWIVAQMAAQIREEAARLQEEG